jgi:hypothetical protein
MSPTGKSMSVVLEEIFTFSDSHSGLTRSWNATAMVDYAQRHPNEIQRFVIGIEPEIVEMCRTKRGVEQWKLDRLTEPYLSYPIVMVELESRTHLMVDGNHRYVRRSELGYTTIETYLFMQEQWTRFLVNVKFPR